MRPRRYRDFWTAELDRMAKKRSALYQKAYATHQEADWSAYYTADKTVKRANRHRKRESFKKFTEKVEKGSPVEK